MPDFTAAPRQIAGKPTPTGLAPDRNPPHGAISVGAAEGTTAAMASAQSKTHRLTHRHRGRRASGCSYRFGGGPKSSTWRDLRGSRRRNDGSDGVSSVKTHRLTHRHCGRRASGCSYRFGGGTKSSAYRDLCRSRRRNDGRDGVRSIRDKSSDLPPPWLLLQAICLIPLPPCAGGRSYQAWLRLTPQSSP